MDNKITLARKVLEQFEEFPADLKGQRLLIRSIHGDNYFKDDQVYPVAKNIYQRIVLNKITLDPQLDMELLLKQFHSLKEDAFGDMPLFDQLESLAARRIVSLAALRRRNNEKETLGKNIEQRLKAYSPRHYLAIAYTAIKG
jgi:uridine kinase